MKKILLSLFVGLIGLINFGYCSFNCSPIEAGKININRGTSYGELTWVPEGSTKYCVLSNDGNITVTILGETVELQTNEGYCINKTEAPDGIARFPMVCSNSICSLGRVRFGGDCNLMTSLECQTEYSLIPVSSVDQNYCVNNGLCPSCPECPDVPIGTGNRSALYINDIQHLGKPIINITFPDYLDWDYTTTENEFNLDIVGYPVDTEYIDGIIRTQNYKPTSEDFTQLVGMLAPYSKYLLFLLFIFIIWAWIKKPFKSKKL